MFDCNKDPKIGTYGIDIGVKTVSKGHKRKVHEDYAFFVVYLYKRV